MGRELTNLSFEQWVTHIFDHPVTKKAWHHKKNRNWWDARKSPKTTVHYMTQLFENAGAILKPYSDAQINQSLWYIDSEGGDFMYTLRESKVPIDDRLRCIASFYNLFEQVFAKRCSPHLSHTLTSLNVEGFSALNSICYMWWDINSLYAGMKVDNIQRITETVLKVMEQTLELNSIACQESALHGLGHWKHNHPDQVEAIINSWLKKDKKTISNTLKIYAERASNGTIL